MSQIEGPPYKYVNEYGEGNLQVVNDQPLSGGNLDIVGGTNFTVNTVGDTTTIENTQVTTSSAGGTESVISDATGPVLGFKGLTAGTEFVLTADDDQIVLSSTSGDAAVTLNNGGEASIIRNLGAQTDIDVRGIDSDGTLIITEDTFDVTIAQNPNPSGYWKSTSSVVLGIGNDALPVFPGMLQVEATGVSYSFASGISRWAIQDSRRIRVDIKAELRTSGGTPADAFSFMTMSPRKWTSPVTSELFDSAYTKSEYLPRTLSTRFNFSESWVLDFSAGEELSVDISTPNTAGAITLLSFRIYFSPV